jgi:hypothetical protein
MANDTDIFGAPAAAEAPGIRDADIFKDLPQQEAVEEPVKMAPKQLTPTEIAYQKVMKQGWGTGLPKVAYDAGGAVAEKTGSPLLGAAVSALPDFINMAIGSASFQAAAPVFDAAGKSLMRSAMKPTLDQVKRGKAAPAVKTMLDEGFNPTAGGVEAMKSRMGDLAEQVKDTISSSGARIDTHKVADFVPQAYQRFQNGPQAVQAIDDLGKVQSNFIQHPNVGGARDIPIQLAQDMKSGYQKAIGDKGYGLLKTPETEGEKQIARGLRELIGEAVPAVQSPLKREADLIQALKIAERRVAIDANKNPIGLGWLAQPWMIPFWMWDRSALAKGLTARALYSGQQHIPATAGAVGGALYGQTQDRVTDPVLKR